MLGAADKDREPGRLGKGPNGGPGPAEAGPGVGTPGSSHPGDRPWCSSALVWPGKYCIKSGLHTVKGHGVPGPRHRNQLEAWKNQAWGVWESAGGKCCLCGSEGHWRAPTSVGTRGKGRGDSIALRHDSMALRGQASGKESPKAPTQ